MDELDVVDLLLVDDRTENLMALAAVLNFPNYNLIKSSSGDEALRYLLDHEPAVILLDVQMPDIDGFETARLIKQNARTRDIPIIFITAGEKESAFVHRGYDHGAVDYIYKPFDAHILQSKVAVFAELSRKTKRLIQAEQKLREQDLREREQKIAQLELRSLRREHADQKKYRELVDGLSHGIVWSANAETLQISFISASVQSILGYSLDDCLGNDRLFLNCLAPEDQKKFSDLIDIVKNTRNQFSLEHRLVASDGRALWFQTGLRIGLSVDGTQVEIRGLSVEITKIKQAEAILRKNKNHSDFLAQASLVLSESLDIETTLARIGSLAVPHLADWYSIHALNSKGEIELISLTHLDAQKVELVRKLANEFPIDPAADNGISRVLRSGKPEICVNLEEACLKNQSKTTEQVEAIRALTLRSSVIVPLIARGKIIGVLTLIAAESAHQYDDKDLHIAEDLARRASYAIDNAYLYEEAQSAIQARDEFLSIASHELKTPITPLKLQIQSLMRTLKTKSIFEIQPQRINKMLEASDRQLSRLSRLIDDLLDISRIRVGKMKLSMEEFDLRELILDVIDRFADQLALSKCEVQISALNSIPVNWDRFRIEQVLINLLTNAMKYGGGKPIQISTWTENQKVKISFCDNGIGINKMDLERIFGRYERAVSGNHFGGLGLGLYIVQQILIGHGGSIAVKSKLGEGSTFTVEIPAIPLATKSDISDPRSSEI